ncbi:RNA binding methyltransferase FtsJ like [hydrothermal vent metagenome]|uniref:RNA binding methyltransferase FtsJ like n=1 Tax=hydrothermal vent metagenome TaxID=652676 RepID=A0A1W1CBR4_9ZZZZ
MIAVEMQSQVVMRLDKYLVDEGYFESRNRALEAIKSGSVTVDKKRVKPSTRVDHNSHIEIADEKFFVSRAGRKLDNFLAEYTMELNDKKALDIGSSTGGFAQILLERGVSSLTCVDVGSDQLHFSLREDSRVSLYEGQDIRDFEVKEEFEVITCDISFISILQVIDDIDRFTKASSDIIILYKPQFEVGRDIRRDSRGVVQDLDAIDKKRREFEAKARLLDWQLKYQSPSKIRGKEGNQEYLYHFQKSK